MVNFRFRDTSTKQGVRRRGKFFPSMRLIGDMMARGHGERAEYKDE